MRISKRKIERAKKLLAKVEKQEKQEKEAYQAAWEKEKAERDKHNAILTSLRVQLMHSLVFKFETTYEPKFAVTDNVRINRYMESNSWEGTLVGYLKGCDKDPGNVVVKIIDRYIDKAYISEILQKMEEDRSENLKDIKEGDMITYNRAWNTYRHARPSLESDFPLIGYAYVVEYEGKNLTEKYAAGFRESNFVKLDSELDKLICEAWSLEVKEKEIGEMRRELTRKNYHIIKKRNELARKNPNLGLIIICNLPDTEEEFMEKSWR